MSNKQDYDFYKSIGICVRCHKNISEPNKVMCRECADKERERDRRKREKNFVTIKKRDMDKYYRLKEQGICTYCKHEKTIPGKTKCQKCFAKIRYKKGQSQNDISRSEWTAYGICYICGKNPLMDGKGVCVSCYQTRLDAINKCLKKRPEGFNDYWKHENKLIFGGKNNGITSI